jgi:diguanylate cyclase (GGDEF)-like protein/putative nucleotidyltransferase with HDIG domain
MPISGRMAAPPLTEDHTHVRFRLRNVQAGAAISTVAASAFFVYELQTWDRPHRSAVAALYVLTVICSAILWRLDLEPVMRRPALRETFFLVWSAIIVGLVSVGPVTDGGAGSPLTAGLFLPLAFAALSYPLASMLAVGAMVVGAYLAIALGMGGVETPEVCFMSLALACATWMCASQARNHDRQRHELGRVSRSDPLTGCLNRRGFEERFSAELGRAARSGAMVSIVLLDLDDFKRVNDEHGHAFGDELLRWVVDTMSTVVRPSDAIGRLGGDEFAILVPDAGRAEATALAERLRAALATRAPLSFGVSTYPLDGIDRDGLHHRADLALYAVKHGRSTEARGAGTRELSWAAALARVVDVRMAAAHEHSDAVADLATRLAALLGWGPERVARLRLAAMLHDVGKVAIPEAILRKPARLTADEMAIVRTHTEAGAEIAARIDGLEGIAAWIRHSHEHVDGSGYPAGLSGDDIPLESRLLLVADAFDAMTSDRAYRAAMPVADALAELRRCAGRQFDARCVELLAQALGERAGALDDVVGLA